MKTLDALSKEMASNNSRSPGEFIPLMLWSVSIQRSFLQQIPLYLFSHFLHQLFSWTCIRTKASLTFTCIFIWVFSFNKIFAVTGSLKSNSPSCQNPGNNNFPNRARRRWLSRVSVLREGWRPAERFLSACSHREKLSNRLSCETYFQVFYGCALLYLFYKWLQVFFTHT